MSSDTQEGIVPAALSLDGAMARIGMLQAWLGANLIAERSRWALWFPAFLGTGIGIYFWLTFEPARWVGPVALLVGIGGVAVALRLGRLLAPAIIVAAIALGFAVAQFQAWHVAAPVLTRQLGPVGIEGRLVLVDPLPEGTRIIIEPRHIDRLSARDMPTRVRVRIRGTGEDLVPGNQYSVRAMLLPPPAPSMPGAYDFQRRAYFDQLGAVGFALSAPVQTAVAGDFAASRWRGFVEATRTAIMTRIRAALPGRTGAIAAALMTGETHAIPPADAGAFRDAGLAHILVIAGLHMGMVAGIVFFAVRAMLALIPAIALRYSTKKWAASASLLTTFLYMLISGATVSSRRAFVMIALMLLGVLFDRVSVSTRTLAYAAIVIMLLAPESATGPSFQMSFAAVAGLVACYETLRPRLSAWHAHAGFWRRAGLYVFGIALTTTVTTIATMPFTIYHFNRFPLYSIVANVLAVPITGFWIMPWAILSCLLMPFGLEAWALHPMGWGIETVAAIAYWVTAWPGAILHVPSMPASGLALMTLGGLWLCIWLGRWRLLGLVPMAAGYATLLFVVPPDILVSSDGKLAAVLGSDGTYLPSTQRGAKSAEETWSRRAAADLGPVWPVLGVSKDGLMSCDDKACLYRAKGLTIAFVRDHRAVRDECDQADLVVSPVAAHFTCRDQRMIDSVDTWKKGGHAIWLEPDGIRTETVADWRGYRLWAREPTPKRLLNIAAAAPRDDPAP